ncbi:MAG TPA: glycosyltransferase family 39 protein, partial [Verrucomicrobiae bacterium]|nr:glycosyltransferase family 39 protein [Verrucomicrobiae bacterium]
MQTRISSITSSDKRFEFLASVCLFLITFAVFSPDLLNGFMGYDDPDYVTSNPNVQAGITFKSLAWAFTTGHAANWHPLTWISHLLDVQVFGLHPWGHHLTSDLVHAGNVILCFLVLHRLTRDRALAFFAALLFGIHPLRVESVAWISERKDVLATFFWFFSILAYTEYARGREPADRVRYYLSSLLLFGCGLLSKPMVVTLPFALMLLDYWPLQRVRKQAVVPILREKIPFFLLSCALAAATIFVQGKGGAMQNPPPLLFRL